MGGGFFQYSCVGVRVKIWICMMCIDVVFSGLGMGLMFAVFQIAGVMFWVSPNL